MTTGCLFVRTCVHFRIKGKLANFNMNKKVYKSDLINKNKKIKYIRV